MAMDILNPTSIVSNLIGSVWIFLALVSIGFFAITSKKRLNFQITIMLYFIILLLFGILFEGILTWVPFIILLVGIIAGNIFSKFVKR